ncbi:MAG: hypothetical protein RBS39_08675 [Phycisphaerales bacterium]|jgi:hypothetical protein|nr:hypothetical protein [Phycisphaerales bacterium]
MARVRTAHRAIGITVASAFLFVASTIDLAMAQGVLTLSDQRAQADAYFVQGGPPVGNFGLQQDPTGADFYQIESQSFTGGGFSGRGYAEHGATFTPSSPLVGGAFSTLIMDACSSAEVTRSAIGPNAYEQAYGLASGVVEFQVAVPTFWTLNGASQGASAPGAGLHIVSGVVELIDINSGLPVFSQVDSSMNGVGNWAVSIAAGGVLSPGSYRMAWSHESLAAGGNTSFGFFPTALGGLPLASCINCTLNLTPVPAPPTCAILGALACGLASRRRR